MGFADELVAKRNQANEDKRQKENELRKAREKSARENLDATVKEDLRKIFEELEKRFAGHSIKFYVSTTEFVERNFHEEKIKMIADHLKKEGFRVEVGQSTYCAEEFPKFDDYGQREHYGTELEVSW